MERKKERGKEKCNGKIGRNESTEQKDGGKIK